MSMEGLMLKVNISSTCFCQDHLAKSSRVIPYNMYAFIFKKNDYVYNCASVSIEIAINEALLPFGPKI